MKILVISDIHSNPWALNLILDKHRDAKVCFLGDMIGYGPDPIGCLRVIREMDNRDEIYCDVSGRRALIGGNHEEAWLWCEANEADFIDHISQLPPSKRYVAVVRQVNERIHSKFNQAHPDDNIWVVALIAILLNTAAMRLEPDPVVNWYRSLVQTNGYGPLEFSGDDLRGHSLILAHGTLDRPLNKYLYPCNWQDLDETAKYVQEQKKKWNRPVILLHGHTHIPMYLSSGPDFQPDFVYNVACMENRENVIVINPGSVGLSRDYDSRPSAVLLEFEDGFLKPTFLRENWQEGQKMHYLQQLEENHYPNEIAKNFVEAKMSSKIDHGNCMSALKKMRRRAGSHWTRNQ